MGGKSTLQGAVLRDKKDDQSSAFDLQSWQGLTSVLKKGKETISDSRTYAEFRNLVLHYAQQGGDVELRKKINQYIETYFKQGHVAPHDFDSLPTHDNNQAPAVSDTVRVRESDTHKENTKKEIPEVLPNDAPIRVLEVTSGLHSDSTPARVMSRRTTPRFSLGAAKEHDDVVVEATHDAPLKTETETEEKHARDIKIHDAMHEMVSHVEDSLDVDAETPEKVVQEIVIPLTHEPERVTPSEPVAASLPIPPPKPKSLEEYRARIAEIKRTVHAEIGNPIALIDASNELGKQYMTALLTALKATGGGGSTNVVEAMDGLEAAMSALRAHKEEPKVLLTENLEETVVQPDPATEVTQKGEESVSSDVEKVDEDTVENTHDEKLEVASPLENNPSTQKFFEVQNILKAQYEKKAALEEAQEQVPAHEQVPVVAPTALPEEIPKIPDTAVPVEPSVIPVMQVVEDNSTPPVVAPSHMQDSVPSIEVSAPTVPKNSDIHRADTLLQIRETLAQKRKSGELQQVDLFTPTITKALTELLHEWSIFAGSGFFGTGPAGIEHPLFTKLASTGMSEVLSGRWEGSDPKITREIKTYVDAWRHEQAVAYSANETFEHYLRRVIQKILKRQGLT